MMISSRVSTTRLAGRLALSMFASFLVMTSCSDSSDLQRVDRTEGHERVVGTLKNGKKHGRWTTKMRGKIFEVQHWRDGKRHGPSYHWLGDDGEMYSDGTYFHDKPHGRFRIFYRPGQLAELGWYYRGYYERTWCAWHPDGSLEYIRVYQQGEVMREELNPPGQCPTIFGEGKRHADPDDKDFEWRAP